MNSQKYKLLKDGLLIAGKTNLNKVQDEEKTLIDQLRKFETHLQTILKHLIQVSINKADDASSIANYKRLYHLTLQSSVEKEKIAEFLKTVLNEIVCD